VQRCQIGAAFVDDPGLGRAILNNRLFKETPRGYPAQLCSEQKINRVTRLAHCPVEIFPLTFGADFPPGILPFQLNTTKPCGVLKCLQQHAFWRAARAILYCCYTFVRCAT
jgi:hypothetical protein